LSSLLYWFIVSIGFSCGCTFVTRVKRRVVSKPTGRHPIQSEGGQLGNEPGPLVNSGARDAKGIGGGLAAAVEGENVVGGHGNELQHAVYSAVKGAVSAPHYNIDPEDDPGGDVDLGTLVKERRKAMGLSQPKLAKLIGGITTSAISEIERGRTKSLSGKMQEGLHRVLGIPLHLLARKRLFTTSASETTMYSQPGQFLQRVAIVGSAQLDTTGEWRALDPPQHVGSALDFPSDDPDAYAIQIHGDAYHPRVKSGEYLVLEPGHAVSPGDEVLVAHVDGRSMIRELAYRRDGQTALNNLSGSLRTTLSDRDVRHIHYVAAIVKATRYREE
jgi:phage repressor protein C with HTH and peptisase S24 domain